MGSTYGAYESGGLGARAPLGGGRQEGGAYLILNLAGDLLKKRILHFGGSTIKAFYYLFLKSFFFSFLQSSQTCNTVYLM